MHCILNTCLVGLLAAMLLAFEVKSLYRITSFFILLCVKLNVLFTMLWICFLLVCV